MIRKIKTSNSLLFISAVTVLEMRGERTVETAWRRKFDHKIASFGVL
jgi:hypothetical protein